MIPPDARTRYEAGVEALANVSGAFTAADWARPACGVWNAEQLAGHVLGVIGWYHHWLDRAIDGDASAPFPSDDMDFQNDRTLAAVDVDGGPARIEAFVSEALRYAERVESVAFDLPYGYPRGTVTVGAHFTGAATLEWHIHAWDLSGGVHQPADAGDLLVAGAELQLATSGRVSAAVQRRLVPLAAKRKPWKQILSAVGRTS